MTQCSHITIWEKGKKKRSKRNIGQKIVSVFTLLYSRSSLFFITRPRWCSPDRSFIYARETGGKSWKLSEFEPSLSRFRISFSSSLLLSISFRQYPHVSSLALIYRRLRIKHVYGLSPSCHTFRFLHTCLDLRRIERKAHLPRSFILFPPRVNSRIRESDDEICTVRTIKTQLRNYVRHLHFSRRFNF